MVNRVAALLRFGLAGETRRLSATLLATQINPIRSPIRSGRQDGEKLEAFVPELVGFLDRLDNFVLERHVSA
jgi:hypothetical protein